MSTHRVRMVRGGLGAVRLNCPPAPVPRLSDFVRGKGQPVKMLVIVDLRNRYSNESEFLEACVRDGVHAFNQHVGDGASVEMVRYCTYAVYQNMAWPQRPALRRIDAVENP